MNYVTDAHPLIWYFTEDPHLSHKSLEIFEGTLKEGVIIVPAMVLAEIMFIVKKGKSALLLKRPLKESRNWTISISHH